jgi:rhodanese-related sulfurtransferase
MCIFTEYGSKSDCGFDERASWGYRIIEISDKSRASDGGGSVSLLDKRDVHVYKQPHIPRTVCAIFCERENVLVIILQRILSNMLYRYRPRNSPEK